MSNTEIKFESLTSSRKKKTIWGEKGKIVSPKSEEEQADLRKFISRLWKEKVRYTTLMAHFLNEAPKKQDHRQLNTQLTIFKKGFIGILGHRDIFTEEMKILKKYHKETKKIAYARTMLIKPSTSKEGRDLIEKYADSIDGHPTRELSINEFEVTDELLKLLQMTKLVTQHLEDKHQNWHQFAPALITWINLVILEGLLLTLLYKPKSQDIDSLKLEYKKELEKAQSMVAFFKHIKGYCQPDYLKNENELYTEETNNKNIYARGISDLYIEILKNNNLKEYRSARGSDFESNFSKIYVDSIKNLDKIVFAKFEQARKEIARKALEAKILSAKGFFGGDLEGYLKGKRDESPSKFEDFAYVRTKQKGSRIISVEKIPLDGTLQLGQFAVILANIAYYFYYNVSKGDMDSFNSTEAYSKERTILSKLSGYTIQDGKNTVSFTKSPSDISVSRNISQGTKLYIFQIEGTNQPFKFSPYGTMAPAIDWINMTANYPHGTPNMERKRVINSVQNWWYARFKLSSDVKRFQEP